RPRPPFPTAAADPRRRRCPRPPFPAAAVSPQPPPDRLHFPAPQPAGNLPPFLRPGDPLGCLDDGRPSGFELRRIDDGRPSGF
ncbi:unnamed protein product, partial [Urochloa humidicola]